MHLKDTPLVFINKDDYYFKSWPSKLGVSILLVCGLVILYSCTGDHNFSLLLQLLHDIVVRSSVWEYHIDLEYLLQNVSAAQERFILMKKRPGREPIYTLV